MKEREKSPDTLCREIALLNAKIGDLERENLKLKNIEDKSTEVDKYRLLFENESDAVMVFDAETLSLEDANRAALELFNYEKDEFLKLRSSISRTRRTRPSPR